MFMRSIHPGEVLRDELEVLGVTPTELARQIKVPANRLSQIINKKRSVTGDTALRLGHWFGVDPQFWINLQSQYDLALAMHDAGATIDALPTLRAAVSGGGEAAQS
jgi:addiction module HigA family antidote